jgi:hypothetical protein
MLRVPRGRLIATAIAALACSCQPLYGGSPEKLRNPPKKRPPPEAAAAAKIPWELECKASFFQKASSGPPRPDEARILVDAGRTAITSSERATEASLRASFVVEAINKYRNALLKDPYSAEATYELAVAYTRVLRKGCALALLKRLGALETHSRFAADGHRMVEAALNDSTFQDFRQEADTALGH